MSKRVMADGKTYDRTSESLARPAHKAEQCSQSKHLCCANLTLPDGRKIVCRAYVHWRAGKIVHDPGTFWEDDSNRMRW